MLPECLYYVCITHDRSSYIWYHIRMVFVTFMTCLFRPMLCIKSSTSRLFHVAEWQRRWRIMQCLRSNKPSIYWWYILGQLWRNHQAEPVCSWRDRSGSFPLWILCYHSLSLINDIYLAWILETSQLCFRITYLLKHLLTCLSFGYFICNLNSFKSPIK